jgi:hypothetical protein
MKNEIPYFKIGHCVRFSKKNIDAWLDEHKKDKQAVNGNEGGELFAPNGSDV